MVFRRTAFWKLFPTLMLLSMIATGCTTHAPIQPPPTDLDGAMNLLVQRIDLLHPGMDRMRASVEDGDRSRAGAELLRYYQRRDSVKHDVDRSRLDRLRGRELSTSNQRIADDAVNNIFVGHSSYPPQSMGREIDWTYNPTGDNEWLFSLHRLSWWSVLGRAYWHTGDKRYVNAWANQMLDWVRKNPAHPRMRHSWRSIEAGHRMRNWPDAHQYLIDTPAMTPRTLAVWLNSVHDHGTWLMQRYSSGSNWAVTEADGLLQAGIFFPELRDADRWRAEAIRRLNREVTRQVYPDGHQRELSISYHVGALRRFANAYEFALLNNREREFSREYLKRLERMAELIMKLALPDGRYAQFGDAWKGERGEARKVMERWADYFGRDDFRYFATWGREGRAPRQTAFAFPDSGLYSMRSGWDENATCLVLKCGPDGGGHSHPDNGTFELFAGGRHLMPDSGVYVYGGDPEARQWFKQSRVHQTLTLNGRDIAYAPRQLLWQTDGRHDVLVVENDNYRDLTHRRAVIFVNRTYFVIIDEAIGNAAGELRLHFQLAPGKAVIDEKRFSARTDFKDGVNLLVQGMKRKGLSLIEERGWVSFEYGKRERRPAIAYALDKRAGSRGERFVTVLVPYEGNAPKVEAEVVGDPPPGARSVKVRITVDGKTTEVGYRVEK